MPLPQQALLFFSLAAVLTLTQCAEKTSDDYVREGIEQTGRQDYAQAMSSFQKAIEENPRKLKNLQNACRIRSKSIWHARIHNI